MAEATGYAGRPRSSSSLLTHSSVVLRRSSKVACRAQVVLSGFDVRDITKADPVATVKFHAPNDRKELARFLGMCVVAMLRNAVHTPEITEPFAKHGWIVSAELAEAPPDADLTEFSIANAVRPEDVVGLLEYEWSMAEATGTEPSTETMMTIKFPRVGGEPRRGKKRRLRAALHEGRAPFVALHSRNAMIAADGVLCMMEQIAHDQPREVTQHVAAVCKRLFETHRNLIGESTPLEFGQATTMYRMAEMLAQADDPSTLGLEGDPQ